jgi:hypothetical protein
MHLQAAHMGNGMVAQSMDSVPLMQGMAPLGQSYASSPLHGGAYRALQTSGTGPVQGAQLVSIQGAPTVQEAGLYEAYGAGE